MDIVGKDAKAQPTKESEEVSVVRKEILFGDSPRQLYKHLFPQLH